MLNGYFISGTDTGVGKTLIAAILVNKLHGIYYKPIQCGLDDNLNKDSDIIDNICKRKIIFQETYFFKNALSPNIAAKFEEREVRMKSFEKILKSKTKKKFIIEGAGGLNVPINESKTMIDLIKFFNLPVILVCRTSLGTINHTLLSINLLKERRIKFKGLVFSGKKEPQTIATIKKFGKIILNESVNVLAHIPIKNKINKKTVDDMKGLFKKI